MKPANFSAATNQNKHQSDPNCVLRSIGATQGMGSVPQPMATESPVEPDSVQNNHPPTLKLMVPEDHGSDDSIDILQSTIESVKQIQQLAERLRQNQSELAAKEANLQAVVDEQKSTANQAQLKIERRLSQLQQQTAQVRLQQRHVMHLQSSLVKSHEASKIAIEQLVSSELTDVVTLQQMKTVQYEVTERFNYLSQRWQQLYDMLENQRVQFQATQEIHDAA